MRPRAIACYAEPARKDVLTITVAQKGKAAAEESAVARKAYASETILLGMGLARLNARVATNLAELLPMNSPAVLVPVQDKRLSAAPPQERLRYVPLWEDAQQAYPLGVVEPVFPRTVFAAQEVMKFGAAHSIGSVGSHLDLAR